jgi:DNA-binding response OmpR family regulator
VTSSSTLDGAASGRAIRIWISDRVSTRCSSTEIEHHIYDEHADLVSNAVDAAICRLRHQIDTPDRPSLVQTRRGMGYIMDGAAR